jgi:serine-type D-Ala-D-Ala carboxypeptidase
MAARIFPLLDAALAGGLGSAAAVSIGDGDGERGRGWRGRRWRVDDDGRADLGPSVVEDAWFDLASLTKPMVSVSLAMIFVERGLLELDAPVRRYVADAATPATLAQLLGHTSGCAAHVKFFEGWEGRRRDGEEAHATLQRLARSHPLAGQPGVDTAYSDLGYITLGEVLERVGGQRLDALFAEHVAGPLGLGCGFRPLGRARERPLEDAAGPAAAARADRADFVATELTPAGLGLGQVHDENARAGGGVHGHAGLFGRIGDVATFARAMLASAADRGGLVGAATARAFFERAPGGASWRLGWDTPSRTPGVSHAGDRWPRASTVGHLGFTGTSLWLDLARGRWCALLTNRVHPSRDGSAERIKLLRRAVMDAAWELFEAGAGA